MQCPFLNWTRSGGHVSFRGGKMKETPERIPWSIGWIRFIKHDDDDDDDD